MGGKNTGYIMGPLQMALGAGALATGVGAPLGIPLIAAGAGETIGQGAGGSKGAGMGEMFGGLAGGLGEGGAGLMGMGPLSGMLGTTGAGQGLQSMLGMAPTGDTQAQNIVSGLTQMPQGFEGGQPAWDLLKQSLSATGQQAGFSNMPSFTDMGQQPAGWGTLGGVGGTPAPSAADSGNWYDNPAAKFALDKGSSLLGGGGQQQSQPQPVTPSFKGPVQQPTPKSQATVTPATTSVPTAPTPPQAPATDPKQAYQTVLGPQQAQQVLSTKPPITSSEDILKWLRGES